ncbi:MAG: bifunctional diaminohydroxyphosphoribosylaminopyrimidine deaminase/5-amino-6-(5-phosphoribosylamino)uracil reductase RibD [Kiritimatiellia bacterium]
MKDSADRVYLRRALSLARLSEGDTHPNPPVGAVVVRGGKVVGQGRHRQAGGPHAEVEAIGSCAESPAGGTLYVTLEPCSTHGRTPPCTELVLRSGVRRVVVGCIDPNPKHAGRGIEQLRAAGIAVEVLDDKACRELIEPFAKRMMTGIPYVTLKLALTLDGAIADRKGYSKWITGEPSRAFVQRLRKRADAVMVGAGTVRADDPSLLCQLPHRVPRRRIVIGSIPPASRVLTDGAEDATTVFEGRSDLGQVLRQLGAEGVQHILCEGGGRLAGALVDGGWVDRLLLFQAPVLLNDGGARPAFAGRGSLLADAYRFRLAGVRRFGDDVLLDYRIR